MRAVAFTEPGGPDVLAVAELPDPEPIPTEVLVRVHAAGVNPVDVKTRGGQGMFGLLGEPPYVLGWDVAGVVEDVGVGVTRFAPGDRVYGMPRFPRQAGAYAELVTAPSRHFARAPDGLDHPAAAALPLAALTAWQALVDTAGVGEGTRVLVHAAAGGVGHLAVQIAKARGAQVLGTARAAKHDFLRGLGADEVIDYTAQSFEEAAGEVDVVLDLIGTREYGERSLACLKPGGLLIEVPSGADPAVLERAAAEGKRATGFLVEPDGHALEAIASLVAGGELRVEVADVIPLAEAARAHTALEEGRTQGKLVLAVA